MFTDIEKIREKAYALHAQGRHREAVQECMVAMTTNPAAPWPYYLAGMARIIEGRTIEGTAFLYRYLKLDDRRFSPHRRKVQKIVDHIETNSISSINPIVNSINYETSNT